MNGMEEVLKAHEERTDLDGYPYACSCGRMTPDNEESHATHVAQALGAAGFGSQHDAWAEGYGIGGVDTILDFTNGGAKYTPNPYPAPKVSES